MGDGLVVAAGAEVVLVEAKSGHELLASELVGLSDGGIPEVGLWGMEWIFHKRMSVLLFENAS